MTEEETTSIAIEENAAEPREAPLSPEDTEMVKNMMELGVFYGCSKARTNPKMRKYILTSRSGFSVIDLEKTIEGLRKTGEAIERAVAGGGLILLVGISPSVKGAVKAMAEELGLPYVTERWLGGTITNFETISKRINQLRKLREEKAGGDWAKYTKKEQLNLERELHKLNRLFGGLDKMSKLPQMVFVADVSHNVIPAKEAKALGIPVAGILNTDANPKLVDCGIAANERNVQSAEFILGKVKEAIVTARAKQAQVVLESPEKEEAGKS